MSIPENLVQSRYLMWGSGCGISGLEKVSLQMEDVFFFLGGGALKEWQGWKKHSEQSKQLEQRCGGENHDAFLHLFHLFQKTHTGAPE